ncbi:MAG: hypothetical protein COA42_06450 [Alteromonadaceae bacterium]|nr:MAG: hypothetical protein COA42_06450 [Alteromonadaceae bacterium]
MNSHTEKTQKNQTQPGGNTVAQKQSKGKSVFQLDDNRPVTTEQENLETITNNSPRTLQLRGFQNMSDNRPLIQNILQLQKNMAQLKPRGASIENNNTQVIQGYFQTHEGQYQSQVEVDDNWGKFLSKQTETVLGKTLGNEIYNTVVHWATADEDWGSHWAEADIVPHIYEQIKNGISEDPEFEASTESDAMEQFGNLIGGKDTYKYMSWIPQMHEMEYYIFDLRKSLDDDADIETLNTYSTNLYKIKNEALELKSALDQAKSNDHDLIIQMQSFLEAKSNELNKLFSHLKKIFPIHSGGFSAKGRAHAIDTSNMDMDDYTSDDSYLKDITLDDEEFDPSSINKKHLNVNEEAANASMPVEFSQIISENGLAAGLTAYEQRLGATVASPQRKNFSTTPVSKDRDGGQGVNMLNTNASAYAMMSQVPQWQSKKWEWLHVRAASLGGATDGTNLVVGTRDANTHMMPFEANIRVLGALVGRNYNYDSLDVSFSVLNQFGAAKHRFSEIKIGWVLRKSDAADHGTKDLSGEAKFAPLSTASSISKDEIGIIETALTGKRDALDE